MMRTLKLTLAYDGTRYAGWQVQGRRVRSSEFKVRSNARATIQGTLERVLGRILQEPVSVVGSGRTDAGVHALAQVAHVNTGSSLSRGRLLRSVNQLLPQDVAVTRIDEVPASFHARFGASRKRYRYRIFTGPVVSPFIRPYVHQVTRPLNVSAMREEATALRGRHNFRAFTRAGSAKGDLTRTITHVRLVRAPQELRLEIEGTGFLHTMVRSIVGTLLDVGRGRLPHGTIRRMLRTGDRRLAGTTAPAKGLALVRVVYGRPRGSDKMSVARGSASSEVGGRRLASTLHPPPKSAQSPAAFYQAL